MSNEINRIANTDYNKKAVAGMITDFHCLCHKKGYIIANDYRSECINNVVAFYEKYLGTHKQKLLDFDYYKIISWYAVFVTEKIYASYEIPLCNVNQNQTQEEIEKSTKSLKRKRNQECLQIIGVAVWRMFKELEDSEGKTIEYGYRDKIIAMVVCEIMQQGEFGIGKNGLYMIMLIARIIQSK